MKIFGDSGSRNRYKHFAPCWLAGDSARVDPCRYSAGGTKTPEFLNKNPNSKIPAVALTEGVVYLSQMQLLTF